MNKINRNQPDSEKNRNSNTPESTGKETGKGMFSHIDSPEAQRVGIGSTTDGETSAGEGSDADMGGGYSNMNNSAEGKEDGTSDAVSGTESRH